MNKKGYMRFPEQEYLQRYELLQENLQEKKLDALMITWGANWTYFTGMTKDTSAARPHFFIAPATGEPIAIIHMFHEADRSLETWIKDLRIYDQPGGIPHEMVEQAFTDLSMSKVNVGAELGFEQRLGLTYLDFMKLRENLPDVKFVDGSDIIWEMRMVKSEEEIKRMRKACEITAKSYRKTYGSLHIGMTEKEIAAMFLDTEVGLGLSNQWATITTNESNYRMISGFHPTDHKIRKGDVIWIDGGGSYSHYWSDYSRMACLGPPEQKQKKYHKLTLEATQSGLEVIKSGATAADVAKACYRYARSKGVELSFRAGRVGHGVGMVITEPPHIEIYDDTVLKPGMVIAVEPGFVTDVGTFHIEENVVVTEEGYDILSECPRSLSW